MVVLLFGFSTDTNREYEYLKKKNFNFTPQVFIIWKVPLFRRQSRPYVPKESEKKKEVFLGIRTDPNWDIFGPKKYLNYFLKLSKKIKKLR